MIQNEQGYIWAMCDYCGLIMGVGFDCGKSEVMGALKDWKWQYNEGKIKCCYCIRDRVSKTLKESGLCE